MGARRTGIHSSRPSKGDKGSPKKTELTRMFTTKVKDKATPHKQKPEKRDFFSNFKDLSLVLVTLSKTK
ncbi:MAG: hypothetical protein JSV87_00380 [Candidatus Bathyarchaeota archaeon]|nr:MAG: hypothetical protein JSV87_00380 [Candidatus Bathyarchaeota archaeon]